MTVYVPHHVYNGLEEVRQSGKTNMFDVEAVKTLAVKFGYPATYEWLEDNEEEHVEGVFEGIESEKDNGEVIQRSGGI